MAARSCWRRTSNSTFTSSRSRIRSFRPRPTPSLIGETTDAYDFYLHAGPISNLKNYLAGASALWDDQVHHDTYDTYWQPRNLAPHMKNIHCAVLTVGGWFDAEDLQGPFSTFHSIDEKNPGIFNALVIGPWCMADGRAMKGSI